MRGRSRRKFARYAIWIPIYEKALAFGFLSVEEGVQLFEEAPLTELMAIADTLLRKQVPHGKGHLADRPEREHHKRLRGQL
jgi:hypothetical protein